MHITKDNIHKFIYGTIMNCDHYGITGIDYIPEGITSLLCLGNKLTNLPHLPEGLVVLNCYNNQLTELPKLPDNLKTLNCTDNNLTSLPKLPDSLIRLNCHNNNLPYIITTMEEIKKHNKLIKRKEILRILSKICV